MRAIYTQSLSNFLKSPFRMVSIGLFILILNLFLWLIPSSSILEFGFADLSLLFRTIPYILMLFIPSIFMNLVVEDFENATSDWIFSKPVSALTYWGGNIFGGLTIVLFFLLLTITSYYSIQMLASNIGVIDHKQIWASYFGLVLLSLVFISISSMSSSVSKNQAGAFLLAVILCYSLYSLPGLLSSMPVFSGGMDYSLKYFSLDTHLEILSRGILEIRTVIYYLSLTGLFSFLTIFYIKKRLV